MIRVLHVIPAVAGRYGGTSAFIAEVCDALNRGGSISCEVAATDADGPESRFTPDRWPAKKTPLHLFPSTSSERQKKSPGLADWLRTKVGSFDLIHSHSVWNYPVYAARVAANLHRKPLVISPHGMLSDYTWGRKRLAKYAYWLMRERGNVRSAAAFHCTSQAEAEELKKYRSVKGSLSIVPLGVDEDAWTVPVDREALRKKCGPAADGKPILLFLSRLHPKKGIVDRLLPALPSSAFLAIVGGPDDHSPTYPEEVRQAIQRLGLSDRVAMIGSVKPAERWAMFDGADLFVLPSHQENFGLVVTEAMARGAPVLITDQVQSGDLVLAAKAGSVVRPGDFATELRRMLESADERKAMGERGREYARDHLSWDRVAEGLVEMYRGVLVGR